MKGQERVGGRRAKARRDCQWGGVGEELGWGGGGREGGGVRLALRLGLGLGLGLRLGTWIEREVGLVLNMILSHTTFSCGFRRRPTCGL